MNRRHFLSGAAATIASIPLAVVAVRLPLSPSLKTRTLMGPEMTATEVSARRAAWMKEYARRIHKVMMTPDIQWFTLR